MTWPREITTNKCRGCHTFDGNECMNGLIPEKNGWECPCIQCLVKPTCTKQCEEMINFDYYQHHQQYAELITGFN